MANREKGEVSLVVGSKTYTMTMDMDAMVAAEEMFRTPATTPKTMVTFQDISEAADRGSMTHLRALLWASLQRHHPEVKVTDISRIVKELGGIGVFATKFVELAKASLLADPQDLEDLGAGGTQNPTHAQNEVTDGAANSGTGARSTSTLVGSV